MRPLTTLLLTLLLAVIFIPVLATGIASPSAVAMELLITDVTIVSPERSEPLENAWVGVREGKIAWVGSGEIPGGVKDWPRVDGDGGFLVPGLLDAHVHLGSVPGMAWNQQEENPELVSAYREQLPRSYLFHGFTSLVDLAPGDPASLDAFRALPHAPDVFSCSNPLVLANGYPMVFGPPEVRFKSFPNFLYDPAQKENIPATFRPEDHSPAATVARVAAAGGSCVKTFIEDGFGPAKIWPVPTVEMLREVATASQEAKLPFLAHANSFDAYTLALDGGAEVLVHGLWSWDGLPTPPQGQPSAELPTPLKALAKRLVETETATMPTLQVIAGDRALFEPAFLEDPALKRVLPEELLAWYGTEAGSWFGRDLVQQLPPAMRSVEGAHEVHTRVLERAERFTAHLATSGGRFLFGSDTPSGPGYGNPPGYNGYLELRRLAEVGIPLPTLFAAATLDNARAFHLDDRYGSVEPGKVANLLLLKKNPLETVEAYDSITTVVLRGEILKREELAAQTAGDSDAVGSSSSAAGP